MLIQAQECTDCQQTTRSQVRGLAEILPPSSKKEPTQLAPSSWTSGFQNCEKMNFSCFSHPVGGMLFRQPWKTKTPWMLLMNDFTPAIVRVTESKMLDSISDLKV